MCYFTFSSTFTWMYKNNRRQIIKLDTFKPWQRLYQFRQIFAEATAANTKHLYNICITSAQRRKTLVQHCTNVIQMFCVCWDGMQI